MIDTIQLKQYLNKRLADSSLAGIGAKPLNRTNGFPGWVLNAKKGSKRPRITFLFPPDGLTHVSAEGSLPCFLFGHNSKLPNQDEVDEAVEAFCSYVSQKTKLDFHPGNTFVSTVHYTRDIHLGEPNVYRALERLKKWVIPRTTKMLYNDTTLYFNYGKRKQKQVRIYPKLQEVLSVKNHSSEAIQAARGKLRFEVCLLSKQQIDSLTKKQKLPNRLPCTILSAKVSSKVIDEFLTTMHFNEETPIERGNLPILMERFPAKQAAHLAGFLELVATYGPKFYLDETLRFPRSTFYTYRKKCRQAGISI